MMPESPLSRRSFLSAAAAGALGLRAMRSCATGGAGGGGGSADRVLYVGTYTTGGRSAGIYMLRMARETGALHGLEPVATTENPSFLAAVPSGRAIYAVNEVAEYGGKPTGTVSAFARDPETGALTPLDRRSSQGAAPCYVTLDRGGRFLLVANYGGGSVAVLPIRAGGGLGDATAVVRHAGHGADPKRQGAPHAHCIVPDPANRFLLVADLGLDRILVYGFDERAGTLSPAPVAQGALAPGAGPRHLVFHPGGRAVYVTNELDSTVTTFRYHPDTGALDPVQTISTLDAPSAQRNAPADVHVHPSGRFLYLSNRGADGIAAFAIDPATFMLRPLQHVSTEGAWPRNFALDPDGRFLLVANQRADAIVVLRVDGESGRLTSTGERIALPAPTCIRFVDESAGAWR
ncbi:MAG TPA: lactonase family protein [Gemmatimonadaceae bacterium]|nr:lactonase family protein [Gemmatimonadaceae bacterium]